MSGVFRIDRWGVVTQIMVGHIHSTWKGSQSLAILPLCSTFCLVSRAMQLVGVAQNTKIMGASSSSVRYGEEVNTCTK